MRQSTREHVVEVLVVTKRLNLKSGVLTPRQSQHPRSNSTSYSPLLWPSIIYSQNLRLRRSSLLSLLHLLPATNTIMLCQMATAIELQSLRGQARRHCRCRPRLRNLFIAHRCRPRISVHQPVRSIRLGPLLLGELQRENQAGSLSAS